MTVITEIYQFIFISSIIFIVYVLIDLAAKMYGRFVLNTEARFLLTATEKIILWASIGAFFSYLI